MRKLFELQDQEMTVHGPYPRIGTLKGSLKTSRWPLKPGIYDLVEYKIVEVKRTKIEITEELNAVELPPS